MANPEAYVREINDIKDEISRLTATIKELKLQKQQQEKYLRKYMKREKLTKFEGITLKSITPRAPSLIKPKDKKREDAINIFRSQGIENPEEVWDELQASQKFQNIDEKIEFLEGKETKSKKGSKKGSGKGSKKNSKQEYSTSSTIFFDL